MLYAKNDRTTASYNEQLCSILQCPNASCNNLLDEIGSDENWLVSNEFHIQYMNFSFLDLISPEPAIVMQRKIQFHIKGKSNRNVHCLQKGLKPSYVWRQKTLRNVEY